MSPSVAVIGGGVCGVGAALAIQAALSGDPEATVTLLAAELTPNTTGDGSAGVWTPRSIDGDTRLITSWGRRTHDFLHQLWLDGRCPGIGVVCGFDIAEQLDTPYWRSAPFFLEMLSERMLSETGQSGKQGFQYMTLYAEPSKMLPFLMEQFKSAGGRVIQTKVSSFNSLRGYDVLVNCTGIGARRLADDPRVTSVRGQVIKVTAPGIKCAKFNFPGLYVIPNDEVIVLGGTAQRDDWREEPDPEDTQRIMESCSSWIPSLASAPQQKVWAGLRPYREGGVRLEVERRLVDGRDVPVVHNYGHGGSGVTLFWGCALDVAALVKAELNKMGNKSKL